MANNIELIQAYAPTLAGIYEISSRSSILDTDETMIRPANSAKEIMIPVLSTSGMADYDRQNCYVMGDITLDWESRPFDYDRGRKFKLDAMDAQESGLSMVTNGQIMGENIQSDYLNVVSRFIRAEVAPETDAYRFAKYAAAAVASSNSETATYTTYAQLNDAITARSAEMTDAGVPETDRHLFILPTLANLPRTQNDVPLAQSGLFTTVTTVPSTRFYSAIDLLDGTTAGEEAGGYRMATTGGAQLNFLIIHKPAVLQHIKHGVNKVISPYDNQTCDGWLFFYRLYQMAADRPGFDAGIFASILG